MVGYTAHAGLHGAWILPLASVLPLFLLHLSSHGFFGRNLHLKSTATKIAFRLLEVYFCQTSSFEGVVYISLEQTPNQLLLPAFIFTGREGVWCFLAGPVQGEEGEASLVMCLGVRQGLAPESFLMQS